MYTKVLKVRFSEVEDKKNLIKEASNAIFRGDVVGFPTETVYGLGANALMDSAVLKLFSLKGRPQDNPLIVHLHNLEDVYNYAVISNELEELLISKITPGPVTFILKKIQGKISDFATASLDTVGIRIPYHTVALKLIEMSGVPIAAPSANKSGRPSPTDAQAVLEDFKGEIPYIIDSGKTHIGIESTVIMVKENDKNYDLLILRPGFITKEDLESLISEFKLKKTVNISYKDKLEENSQPLSPGQKYRHYSPKCHVAVVGELSTKLTDFLKSIKGEKIGILGRGKFLKNFSYLLENIKFSPKDILKIEWCEEDLIECARNVFDSYRYFDRENVFVIFVEKLEEKGLGYSIMNRVKKSATYNF